MTFEAGFYYFQNGVWANSYTYATPVRYDDIPAVKQADGQYHTYMGARVPRYWSEKDVRELRVSSRPILCPKTKNPFISAKVLD